MRFDGLSMQQKKIALLVFGGIVAILAIISVVVITTQSGGEIGGGGSYEDDRAYDEEAAAYYEQYPIISHLPIIGDGYRIDYGICEQRDADFCIMISSNSPEARERAQIALYNADSSQSGKYPIEYYDLEDSE